MGCFGTFKSFLCPTIISGTIDIQGPRSFETVNSSFFQVKFVQLIAHILLFKSAYIFYLLWKYGSVPPLDSLKQPISAHFFVFIQHFCPRLGTLVQQRNNCPQALLAALACVWSPAYIGYQGIQVQMQMGRAPPEMCYNTFRIHIFD